MKLPQVPSSDLQSRLRFTATEPVPYKLIAGKKKDARGHCGLSGRSGRNLPGQPRSVDGRRGEPMGVQKAGLTGRGGGISRAEASELSAGAAAPARGRAGSAAAGGAARRAVGGRRVSCRRPAFATMPGIDKLPIEETLEDSPQVRRGRRRRAARGLAGAWRLRGPRPSGRRRRSGSLPAGRDRALPSGARLEARAAGPRAVAERPPLSPVGPGLAPESAPALRCLSRAVLFVSRWRAKSW